MNEREIFTDCLKFEDASRRAEYLDQVCQGMPDLREQVERLLREHEQLGSFLEIPPVSLSAAPTEAAAVAAVGTSIGPYKLLQKIGEGGMGAVFMAEQATPVRRRVALKVIKAGMDSSQVIARFEAERQALALMDHPNIARVLDGGTTQGGRPYFVMELVKGVALTDYCDENQLTPQERLDLFIPVCLAVQHAHQKGIIHRDIKPSNVMVTICDGKPVPKVIDFGVSKAIEQRLTERTMFTAYGQIIGTLEYISPEQAEISGTDVDTRSDIYSLGVLAYELLTGTTPLERKTRLGAAYSELLRQIREEEPPKPSTRLSDSGQELAAISARRRTEPAKLRRVVSGELDWIVMKALDKDRARRYQTASDLARDVERYLRNEPVEACAPSAGYRLAKFVRRHHVPVVATGLVAVSLLGGMVISTWALWRAEQARQLAQAREQEALMAAEQERLARNREASERLRAEANERRALAEKQTSDAVQVFLLHDLLGQADPVAQANAILQLDGEFDVKENPTIRELLARAATELTPSKLQARFPGQPTVQASILLTVGDTYGSIGEFGRAIEFLRRAGDLYEKSLGADDAATLKARRTLAWTYRDATQPEQAIALLEKVQARQIEKLGPLHKDTLDTMAKLGVAYRDTGKRAKAIAILEQAAAGQKQVLGSEHAETLDTLGKLAVSYRMASQLTEAVALLKQVHDAMTRNLGPHHPATLATWQNLVWASYVKEGKTAASLAALEEICAAMAHAFGPDHPTTLNARVTFALINLDNPDKRAHALKLLEEAKAALTRKIGADHVLTLNCWHNLAVAYKVNNRLPEAIDQFEKLHAAEVKKLGAEHSLTVLTQSYLGLTYCAAGETAKALPLYLRNAELAEKRQFQEEFSDRYLRRLIDCQQTLKFYAEAELWSRKLVALTARRSGKYSWRYARDLTVLCKNLLKRQKWQEAACSLRELVGLIESFSTKPPAMTTSSEVLPPWTLAAARSMLGTALAGQKQFESAEKLLLDGYGGLTDHERGMNSKEKVHLNEALERLVRLYEEWGKPESADRWRKQLAKRIEAKP